MTQRDPIGTSVGRFRVGDSKGILGRWARQTDKANAKQTMTFDVDPQVFKESANVYLRVCYYDEGKSSWEATYSGAGGASSPALQIHTAATNRWLEAIVELRSTSFAQKTTAPMLTITQTHGDDAVIGFIELSKQPFLYHFAELSNTSTLS